MLGKKKSETNDSLIASNDIMILNVTELSSLTSLGVYSDLTNDTSIPNTTSTDGQSTNDHLKDQSDDQSTDQSKGLSGGAIAGIVVGVVVVVRY